MPKITPHLWMNNTAEEAVQFYVSVFPNSRVLDIQRIEGVEGVTPPLVVTARCVLDGQEVMLLNGGPDFTLNESFSFMIECQDQKEVDYYWDTLISGGGEPSMCGWLKDRFGLSWQVVPVQLGQLLSHPDPEKARRVMEAMLKMRRLDITALEAA